jgi:hypothetical protein
MAISPDPGSCARATDGDASRQKQAASVAGNKQKTKRINSPTMK